MEKNHKIENIHWLNDDEYHKAVGQLRLKIGGILTPLNKYGQEVYCIQASAEIVKLCEDFGLRVRGVDHPIETETTRRLSNESVYNLPN